MSVLADLEAVCSDIFDRWDMDMRSGKLLLALSGSLPRYDPRIARIRAALASADRNPEGQDPQGLGAEHESAVPNGETPQ